MSRKKRKSSKIAPHPGVQNKDQALLPPRDVGARLRTLRLASGLSQRAVARAAGVTNATISNIEQNLVSPSVASLRKITRSMGTSLADFFAAETIGPPQFFFRASELSELGSNGVSLQLIPSTDPNRSLQILRERYEPGADTGAEMLEHLGEEAGIILEGSITIAVGDQEVTLGPGDAYQFPSNLPHRFRNLGDEPCVLMSAATPPTF